MRTRNSELAYFLAADFKDTRGKSKVVKYRIIITVRSLTCHTATRTHTPYRITQCYLPPDRGDIPAFEKGKGSPYSIKEGTVPELIPVLGTQPAGDVSHKPGSRLPLLSARPAVTIVTLKRVATNFAIW